MSTQRRGLFSPSHGSLHRFRAHRAVGFLWLAIAPLAAQTIVVGPGGQFADLAAAVAAAPPGAEILLLPNTSTTAHSPTVIRRALTIRGQTPTPSSPVFVLALTIDALPAGQSVIVRDLVMYSDFRATNCAGTIHIERAHLYGGADFDSCQQVVVVDSTFDAFAFFFRFGQNRFTRSTATVDGSFVSGLVPSLVTTPHETGLYLDHSLLNAARSYFYGGSYWSNCLTTCYSTGRQTPAISSIASTMYLGQGCVLPGSTSRSPDWYTGQYVTTCGNSIEGTAIVVQDPTAQINCRVAPLRQLKHLPDLVCGSARRGRTATPTLRTAPATIAGIFASLPLPGYVATPFGLGLVDVASISTLAIGVTDVRGELQAQLPISPFLQRNSLISVQGVALTPTGLQLTFPAQRVVTD